MADNRLRFVHFNECFNTVEDAKNYVGSLISEQRPALYAEPMILKYGDPEKPSILLCIGSKGDGVTPNMVKKGKFIENNSVFYIDFATIEEQVKGIDDLKELTNTIINSCGFEEDGKYTPDATDEILKGATSLKEAVGFLSDYLLNLEKRYKLSVADSDAVVLNLTETEEGNVLTADVKVPSNRIYNSMVYVNQINKGEDGIFFNVEVKKTNEEGKDKISLLINGSEASYVELESNTHLVSGSYDKASESLILTISDGSEVSIPLTDLIDEWNVESVSSSPIVLKKEHVAYVDPSTTPHEEVYQDILSADVTLSTSSTNILKKSDDGKSLIVEGLSSNIKHGDMTVEEALNSAFSEVSPSNENIISSRWDGLFANVNLSYNAATNTLEFSRSVSDGTTDTSYIQLNSFQLLKSARFDKETESIIIEYQDEKGFIGELVIPVADLLDEYGVDNANHNVSLSLARVKNGKSLFSGDVNISNGEHNILTSVDNALYVKGTADNIYYDANNTVASKVSSIETKADATSNIATQTVETVRSLGEAMVGIRDVVNGKVNSVDVAKVDDRTYNIVVDNVPCATSIVIPKDEEIATLKTTYIDSDSIKFIKTTNPIGGIIVSADADYSDLISSEPSDITLEIKNNKLKASANIHDAADNWLESDGYDLFVSPKTAVDIKYDDVDSVFSKINEISAIASDVTALASKLSELENIITTLSLENQTLANKVQELEAKNSDLETIINQHEIYFSDMANEISALTSSVDRIDAKATLYDASTTDEGRFEFVAPSESNPNTGIKFILDNTDLNTTTSDF